MNFKRITIISGHYGSGKTNIAVSLALDLKKQHENTAIADIDIVNPYFRTKDSEQHLKENGIRLICSEYANSNVDIPALPQEMYAVTDDKSMTVVVDVGGDDRGALALGRLTPEILKENDYEMLLVVNRFRPLTRDADSTIEVMREIEAAGKIPFTGIINNSNLGKDTTEEDIIASFAYAKEISEKTKLPILLTSVDNSWYDKVSGNFSDIFPLKLQPLLR